MKKLNEHVLKQLILETIEESLVTEGRKKKIREAEPVPTPQATLPADQKIPSDQGFGQPSLEHLMPRIQDIRNTIDMGFDMFEQKPVSASLEMAIIALETRLKELKQIADEAKPQQAASQQ